VKNPVAYVNREAEEGHTRSPNQLGVASFPIPKPRQRGPHNVSQGDPVRCNIVRVACPCDPLLLVGLSPPATAAHPQIYLGKQVEPQHPCKGCALRICFKLGLEGPLRPGRSFLTIANLKAHILRPFRSPPIALEVHEILQRGCEGKAAGSALSWLGLSGSAHPCLSPFPVHRLSFAAVSYAGR
jgi:hypothetical protein